MILKDVCKKYGRITALDHVSLALNEGEITAVLGESGAGKTTLLNVLAGQTAFEGSVEGRKTCSYLFQLPKLLPNLTADQNLKFVLPKSLHAAAGGILAKVGLAGRERAYPHELSGGERQRVAIARAFLYPHEMLLMDEPFASLDLSLKKSLIELVASLWAQSKNTIVFVTHDVHEAATLAHRAIVLKHGRIVADLAAEGAPPRDFFAHTPCEERLVHILTEE
mgnify:CR=1 FL=1